MSAHMSTHMYIRMSTHMSTHMSAHISKHVSVHTSMHMSIHMAGCGVSAVVFRRGAFELDPGQLSKQPPKRKSILGGEVDNV